MKNFFKSIVVFILTLEAKLVLKKYNPKIVGVTGSVGKTSTKDAIATVLGSSFYIRKSQKSFNTEIGIPLTILGCDNGWNNPFLWLKNIFIGLGVIVFPNHYPDTLVLEVGLDRPGDIQRVVKWVDFDVVVYTRLSDTPVHVEFFESVEALLKEKAVLMSGLKRGGVLVTNKDDLLQKEYRREGAAHFTYGFSENALVVGSHVSVSHKNKKPAGITFRMDYSGSSVPVKFSGVLGEQHVYPALAACSVGLSQDLNLVQIGKALTGDDFLPGRMRILDGKEGSVIIDDSYNASPVALHAALDVLGEISVDGEGGHTGRKICVLGDMTELGKLTVPAHEDVGKHVAQIANVFIAVGHRMENAAEAAHAAGLSKRNIISFPDSQKTAQYMRDHIQNSDIVLVKGSQVVRMEKVVKEILAHPEKSRELLVRQESVWLKH